MATDSVMGVFQDPQQYQQQALQQQMKQNYDIAGLSPEQQVTGGLRNAGYQLGGAVGGLMGAQDPQMKLAALRTQVLQGLDPNDAASIGKAAQALAQAGDQQGAMQLAQKALEIRNTESQISGRTEEKQAQRDMQVQIERERNATRLEAVRLANEAKVEAAKERGASQKEIAQLMLEGRRELAAITQGTKQTLADEKVAAVDQQRVGAVASFNDALTTLDVLKKHEGKAAAVGFGGSMSSMVPGTAAYGFGKQLETFKAQTFIPMVSALKGMGALSDAEGKKLTDSVGALDQGMKPAEFDSQVTAIENKLKAAKARAEAMVKDKTLLKPFEQPASVVPKATKRWNPNTNSFEVIQ